jgi:hypothetical protein
VFDHLIRCLLAPLTLCLASRLGAQQPLPEPVDSAHGRIVFTIGESYADSSGRTRILLDATTEKRYSCLLPLAARMTRTADAIALDQWNIPPVDACPSAMGPASGTINLPWDVGTHTLVIRHLGAEDRYRVLISSDAIRVVPDAAPGRASILGDTLVWRFPRNSFAVRCGTIDLHAWVCAELLRLLDRTPGIEPVDIPLGGRDPFGDRFADYGHWHNEPARYFRTVGPRDLPRLQRELQSFYDAWVGRRLGYSITIRDWTGHVWFTTAARDGEIR